MYWNKPITIYNAYEDSTGEKKYIRHNLNNCFVKRMDIRTADGTATTRTGDTIVRIPKQENYISAYEWQKSTAYNMLTVQVGDIIVLGLVNDEIRELENGKRSKDLKKKYQAMGVIEVAEFNDNTFLPLPHYHIRGK